LACERGYLTLEMLHQALSVDDMTPENLTTVRLAIAQAGVRLIDASAVDPVRSAAHTALLLWPSVSTFFWQLALRKSSELFQKWIEVNRTPRDYYRRKMFLVTSNKIRSGAE